MTWFLAVVLGAVATLSSAAPTPPAGYYATKYDHINVETILNTRRLVNYYAACLTNKGPCPPQGIEFKRILPEALHTNCARCTEKQKTVALRTIKRLRKEYPKVWAQLSDLWDPTGEYIQKFEDSFNKNKPVTTETPITTTIPPLDNRFGDSSDVEVTNSVSPSTDNKPYPPLAVVPISTTTTTTSSSTTSTTTATTTTISATNTPSTSTVGATIIKAVEVTQKNFVRVTNRPFTDLYGINIIPNPINAVSIGPKVAVKGLVRSLGSLGSKVIEAGSRIAGMLISTVQTVVRH